MKSYFVVSLFTGLLGLQFGFVLAGSTAQQINLFESREREPFCGPASGMR